MRRMLWVFALVALALGSDARMVDAQSGPQNSGLLALDSGVLGRGWEAVGRIDIGQRRFCTGALIAPDLVLTAAHCLFDRETGARIADDQVRFLAGWRSGRAEAEREVRRSAVHPDYRHGTGVSMRSVAHDLALLELAHPIRQGTVTPFEVHSEPVRGDRVGVVSYARGRSEAPSLEEQCAVLQRDPSGVLVMSCEADFGASGAPVFSMAHGQVRIVSVISAKAGPKGAEASDRVSLGASLGLRLDTLRTALAAGDRRFVRVEAVANDAPRQMSSGGGARFVRP